MSITPRTDAAITAALNRMSEVWSDKIPAEVILVACDLERENTELLAANAELITVGSELSATADELRAENAELRREKARLDWLERPQQITHYVNPFRDVVHRTNSGQTLREAIDAAMEAGK